MRERAMAIGGTLDVGPGADGGTVVTVRVPVAQA
jgi:signal transduction histidine kinase